MITTKYMTCHTSVCVTLILHKYKQKYQHHLNFIELTLVSISTLTSSPSSVASTSFVSSTITTASAPGGTGAPVLILITCQEKRQNKKVAKSKVLERKEKGKTSPEASGAI